VIVGGSSIAVCCDIFIDNRFNGVVNFGYGLTILSRGNSIGYV
jgi:hypothetical protein